MNFLAGSPETNEYHPHFEGYVSLARGVADPVARLSEQLDEVLGLLGEVPEEKRLFRYATGKWCVQELVGHLTETERIFAYRLLRVSRGDQTPLPGFDENYYVAAAESEKCDWDRLVAELAAVRVATVLLLGNLPEAAWTRMGTSNGHPISVRALVYIMIGHVDHHMAVLRERYLN